MPGRHEDLRIMKSIKALALLNSGRLHLHIMQEGSRVWKSTDAAAAVNTTHTATFLIFSSEGLPTVESTGRS